MNAIEQLHALEIVRDRALADLARTVPYHQFLGVEFERLGDELTARLRFDPKIIGNPMLPALHGGATGSFLEMTAIMQLAWDRVWEQIELGAATRQQIEGGVFPPMPRTIDITVDYLRSGRARDAYARAVVAKRGRRVANVRVEAWQDERSRPFAAAHGHFLLPG
ncbi:MAG: PaaI family thioesterase [Neomegalonema sp.]|nr:PaaI family thioesterase [Neomegalonema sp.]